MTSAPQQVAQWFAAFVPDHWAAVLGLGVCYLAPAFLVLCLGAVVERHAARRK